MNFVSVDCILIRFRVEVWDDVTKLNDVEHVEGELRGQKMKTTITFKTIMDLLF